MTRSIQVSFGLSLLLAWASGCLAPDAVPEPAAPDGACLWSAPTQSARLVIDPGTYYLRPGGADMFGGRSHRWEFSDEAARLAGLRIVATWPTGAVPESLRLALHHLEASTFADYWAYGPVEGPSPLVLEVNDPDVGRLGDRLSLQMGAPVPRGALPASVILQEHVVTVTLEETYRC